MEEFKGVKWLLLETSPSRPFSIPDAYIVVKAHHPSEIRENHIQKSFQTHVKHLGSLGVSAFYTSAKDFRVFIIHEMFVIDLTPKKKHHQAVLEYLIPLKQFEIAQIFLKKIFKRSKFIKWFYSIQKS